MPNLIQPDFSIIHNAHPRIERYQSVIATPFHQGQPITPGKNFPYPICGALYSEAGALIALSQRVSGVAGDHVVLADPEIIEDRSAVDRLKGRGCYLGHLFNHYGHFMTESISAVWPLNCGEEYDYYAIHPFGPKDGLNATADWVFRRLGIEPRKVHIIRHQTFFEDLTVPERTWQHNRIANKMFREIATLLSKPFSQKNASQKLYLSRKNIPNRRVENEPEIEEHLLNLGYHIIYPETLTIEEQLKHFGSCDILAGFAGSALHSILFCRPGTAVISLGDRRSKDILMPNQRLCNAINFSMAAVIPFAEGDAGFDLGVFKSEFSVAEELISKQIS